MGTTSQKLQAIANSKAAIKAAIEAKGVTGVGDVLSAYAGKIADIPAGGGAVYDENKHLIRWWDIDGTCLKEEYVATGGAATPPTAPSHTHLTFYGWNYSASEYGNITGPRDIGAVYDTDDDALWLKVDVGAGVTTTLRLRGSVGTIDWGDGTIDDLTGSGPGVSVNYSHTYNANYTGFIKVVSNSTGSSEIAISSSNRCDFIERIYCPKTWTDYNAVSINFKYMGKVEVLSIGRGITNISITTYSFTNIQAYIFPNALQIQGELYADRARVISVTNSQFSSNMTIYSGSYQLNRLIIPGYSESSNATFYIAYNQTGAVLSELVFPDGGKLQNNFVAAMVRKYVAPENSIEFKDNSMTISSLTHSGMVDFFRALKPTQTSKSLGCYNFQANALTDEEKAIAINKGYSITY